MEAVNTKIFVSGSISQEPWQHIIFNPKGFPFFFYFDLEDDYQIVIYSKTDIPDTSEPIRIFGKIIAVEAGSKRPGTKIQEKFTEYQMLVETWEII